MNERLNTVKVILGATKDGDIATAELAMVTSGERHYLSASFSISRPFNTDDINEEYAAGYLDGLDKEILYDLCVRYCCSPQNLPYEFYENNDIDDLVDCSLFPRSVTIDNDTFMFESQECGQVDLGDRMEEYTDRALFCRIYILWKVWHLRNLNSKEFKEVCDELNAIAKIANELDEEEWLTHYIKVNCLDLPDIDGEEEDD